MWLWCAVCYAFWVGGWVTQSKKHYEILQGHTRNLDWIDEKFWRKKNIWNLKTFYETFGIFFETFWKSLGIFYTFTTFGPFAMLILISTLLYWGDPFVFCGFWALLVGCLNSCRPGLCLAFSSNVLFVCSIESLLTDCRAETVSICPFLREIVVSTPSAVSLGIVISWIHSVTS